MQIQGIQQKLGLSLLLGVAVVLGLGVYGDGPRLLHVLARFDWALLPAVLALTLCNYALRFVKWSFYLKQIGVRVALLDSFATFTAGLSMAMTPGKVGELLKPILLRLRAGTPISRSAPIVVAERLTDGIAMIVLAVGGLLLSHAAWQVILASLVLAGCVVGLLGTRSGSAAALRLAGRAPFLGQRLHHVEGFLLSSRALFAPRNLGLAVLIGVVSWGAEALAFYLVLLGIGLNASMTLFIKATFVLATSTLVGSLSLLPGGLGAADASVAGLLILVVHVARSKAAAATILIRFATLWFGVCIGLFALWLFRGRFRAAESAAAAPEGHGDLLRTALK